jgi:hypothetical protein
MENVKRLSIEDFKLNKLKGSTEIENLLGGLQAVDAAADCHVVPTTWGSGNTVYIKSDPV